MPDTNPKRKVMHLLEMDVADIASLPALKRHATHLLRFLHRTGGRFVHDQCIQRASALAYASLLAIVPLVALGVSIFTSFHAFDLVAGRIRDMLAFWATLTLAPVLIGASITITSYFAALPVLRDVTAHAATLQKAPFLIPWVMSSLALATLYMVLPNTRVPFRFAISGGLIAGALFELTKYGFAFYVTELAHYERLYGALGTLPIFLIWLYLTWVVVLMGSEIVFCLQHPEQSHRKNVAVMQPGMQKFFAHLILVRAAEALRNGRMLHMGALSFETGVPDNILQEWLDTLCKKGLLRAISDNGMEAWVPGRDAARLYLTEIYDALADKAMCVPEDWCDTTLGRTLAGLYFRLERERRDALAKVSVRDLIVSEENESA